MILQECGLVLSRMLVTNRVRFRRTWLSNGIAKLCDVFEIISLNLLNKLTGEKDASTANCK